MKKIYSLMFLILTSFFICDFVNADACPYKDNTSKEEIIINFDTMQQGDEITFSDGNNIIVANYSSYEAGAGLNVYGNFFSDKNYEDTQTFLNERGGQCPEYFYVYSDMHGSLFGYFSDKVKPDFINVPKADYTFQSIALEPDIDDKDNIVSSSNNRKVYTLTAIDFSFETTVQIEFDLKNLIFSNGTFLDETTYESKYDYSKIDEYPKDLQVCYIRTSDSASRIYYISTTDDTSYDSGSYFCSDLVKSGEVEAGTNYCKIYVDNRTAYINYYDSNNHSAANQVLNKLKSFCSSIVSNSNYDSYKYSCINLCLNMSNDLPGIVSNSSKCGLSEKLIIYIANIVKWIKYIVPVIVIVLGILDFIQAIAADKEDEMKKAQGRFVKRLIAAALIFIIPFIIEFVLNKMGFSSNGCGIIDL